MFFFHITFSELLLVIFLIFIAESATYSVRVACNSRLTNLAVSLLVLGCRVLSLSLLSVVFSKVDDAIDYIFISIFVRHSF